MKGPRKIAVAGFYGMTNFGDDLFCHVLANSFRSRWPGARVKFVAPPVFGVQAKFMVPAALPIGVYQKNSNVGAMSRLAVGTYAWLWSDSFVLGGGSILASVSGVRRVQERLGAWLGHPKLYGLGVSVGPFRTDADEDAVREFISKFSYLAVRDSRSFEIVKSMRLPGRHVMSGDLAALAEIPFSRVDDDRTNGPVGLAPCKFPGFEPARYREVLDLLADKLLSRGEARVRVFSLNNHPDSGDDSLCFETALALRERGVGVSVLRYSDVGVVGVWQEIAKLSAMISTRLHGAIASYMVDVPTMVFEYHQKCADFCDDVGQPAGLRLGPLPTGVELDNSLNELFRGAAPRVSARDYQRSSRQALRSLEL